jgi:hypothetical protein
MTALTVKSVPARLEGEETNRRPVPWRRMAWITWRQHRLALSGVAALVLVVVVGFGLAGLQLHNAYSAAINCHPQGSFGCNALVGTFNGINNFLTNGGLLQLVAPLVGAFLGAPLLARELESGTFRYVATQGFGRWRWALAKLVGLGAAVMAAGAVMSLLFTWYYQPYFAVGTPGPSLTHLSPFDFGLFNVRGVAFVGWMVVAFAIGCLAGTLIRRVVPAIAATLAAYTGLSFVAAALLRRHYLPAIATNSPNVPGTAWVVSQWGTRGGNVVFTGAPPMSVIDQSPCANPSGPGKGSWGDIYGCLTHHGYVLWTSYQPTSRFWAFQWIEAGWLVALSVLLIAVSVWLVRRREV